MSVGYPAEFEADVVLRDGSTAHLRPITPEDAGLLVDFYSRVSDESKYYRFFAPYPQLSARDVARFTQVDYHDRLALIVLVGDPMIAVGRYERTGPDRAEVAFLVEDEHQGRGLGQLLLEHLAQAARENGIAKFTAEVLPDNRRMLTVFTEAGYHVAREFEDGVIVVEFDIAPTDTSVGVMQAREQRSEALSIERLLTPSSVAVIGASRHRGTIGNALLRNLRDGGFTGTLYAVNTEAGSEIDGVAAYPSIRDIEDRVDLAVVAVPADAVADVVLDCAAKGVRGLVVVSGGFAEIGDEGRKRQRHLVGLARSYGLRVIGPNCLGVINTDPAVSLNASLSPLMPGRGRVAFFCQSGALGVSILADVVARGLGLSTFVSAGNRADVSGNDLMQYWYSDDATEVVLLYLESLGNPRKFSRVARRLARRKPVVTLKSGRATQGVPLGHTVRRSQLPPASFDALSRQSGLIGVDTPGELFDVAQLLAHQPLPEGNNIAIVSNSDALTLLAMDAAVTRGLEVVDETTLGPDAGAGAFAVILERVLADERVHSVVVIFTPPVHTSGSDVARVLAASAAGSDKPVVSTFLASRSVPQLLRVTDEHGGAARGSIPSYSSPQYAVGALAKVTAYAEWRRQPDSEVPKLSGIDTRAAEAFVADFLRRHPDGADLDADDRQLLLGHYGLDKLPAYPVVVTAVEDVAFGPVVSFGLAGVATDLLDDWSYRMPPLLTADAAEMVREVRAAPLLFEAAVDLAAVEDLLHRVSRLTLDLEEVVHLELRPPAATVRIAPNEKPRQDTPARRLRNA